jgi:hypothetical protein
MIRCVSALRSYIDTILLKSYLFFFSLLICSGVGDMMKPYYRTHVSDPNEIGDCETKLRCMLRAIWLAAQGQSRIIHTTLNSFHETTAMWRIMKSPRPPTFRHTGNKVIHTCRYNLIKIISLTSSLLICRSVGDHHL